MRKTLLTSLLLVAALAGLAFVWFHERHLDSTKEKAEAITRVLPFPAEEINALSWSGGESNNGAILGDDGLWRLREPEGELLNPEWANRLNETLGKLIALERITAAEFADGDAEVESLGFEGGIQLDLATKDGRSVPIRLGKAGPLTNTVYLSTGLNPGTEDDVVLVRSEIARLMAVPATSLVDPRLARVSEPDLTLFYVKNASHEMEVSRPDPEAYWELVRPLNSRVGEDALEIPMLGVSRTKILESLQAAPTTVSAGEPDLVVKFESPKTGEPLLLEAWIEETTGDGPPTGLARSSARPGWYRISGEILDLAKLHPTLLRDRNLARINVEALQGVLLRLPGQGVIPIRLQGEQWTFQRAGRWERASAARVEGLIDALNTQEVVSFHNDVGEDDPFGLDQPFLEVVLTTEKNPTFKKDPEGVKGVVLRFGRGADQRLYGAYSHEPFVYGLDPSILAEIPLEPIRWKSLSILSFSPLSLRKVTLAPGSEPPVELDFDPLGGGWKGSRGGSDLTELIDHAKTEEIGSMLSSFQCDNWISDAGSAVEYLKKPSLAVRVSIEQGQPDGTTKLLPIDLIFAPTSREPGQESAFYYGMIKGLPEIFLIHKDRYQLLSEAPLDLTKVR